jgi:hypothetical protein
MAAKIDKIFSGSQPCQAVKNHQLTFNELTRLIAQEEFINLTISQG